VAGWNALGYLRKNLALPMPKVLESFFRRTMILFFCIGQPGGVLTDNNLPRFCCLIIFLLSILDQQGLLIKPERIVLCNVPKSWFEEVK
jgi:hypothetical protein